MSVTIVMLSVTALAEFAMLCVLIEFGNLEMIFGEPGIYRGE